MAGQRLKIGIDFDGVLFDQVPHIIQGFRSLHGVDLHPVDTWHWQLSEHPEIQAAGLTDEEVWDVFRQLEVDHEIHQEGPLDPHAIH
ncbi:MAG: hypothetical protein R3185_07455, partial [Candidatus Thermoplasmatota archaeon]|nr:hypothetical protein [Candidatus Thermoplasmatota archaeon]